MSLLNTIKHPYHEGTHLYERKGAYIQAGPPLDRSRDENDNATKISLPPCYQRLSLDSLRLKAQVDTPTYLGDIRERAERAGSQTHTSSKIVSPIRCKTIWNGESTRDAQMSL